MPRYKVKVLGDEDRSRFVSPHQYFTEYFHKRASRAQKQRVSVVYIVQDTTHSDQIVGYYTLSNSAINTDLLKQASGMSLARYSVTPTTLLGMLSRCEPTPEPEFGRALLFQALVTCALASTTSASAAVILDPYDRAVSEWYRRLAFKDLFPHMPGAVMFYEMRKIQQLGIPPWPGTFEHLMSAL